MPGVVLIVLIPDICLLLYFLYSHEYRLTRNTVYFPLRSNSGWLPIMCAYFILMLCKSSTCIYLPVPRRTSFVDLLCFFCPAFAMPLCASVYVPCGHLLGKG